MIFKDDVDARYLSAPAWYGLWKCDQLHKEVAGRELVCTSTGEGRHSVERSRHYTGDYRFGFGDAFDVRIWYLEDPESFTRKMREVLGEDYVVILEDTHIHCHWSPVYREMD